MDTLPVTTENPEAEQWRLLSQFAYYPNIRRHLQNSGFGTVEDETVQFVAGSIRQSQAFFQAAEDSPLDISPLLLYYGATNLLIGAYILKTNDRPNIKHHGMIITDHVADRIADVRMLPRYREHGGLQQFANVFSNGCDLTNGHAWTMGEILGAIPDLRRDFERHYQDLPYYAVPVEVIRTRQRCMERISNDDLTRYPGPEEALSQIPGLSQAYLVPQYKPDWVVLHPKLQGVEIGTYSSSNRKYLQIGHNKGGGMVVPNQLILLYMGLFVLGFLPRYLPALWNPFVQSDTTGEKLIVEKFLAICQRYMPNLVLNSIFGRRIQFLNETEGILDLTTRFTEDELKQIVKETVRELREQGEIASFTREGLKRIIVETIQQIQTQGEM